MFKSLMIASAMVVAMAVPSFASGGCEDTAAWTKMEGDINAMAAGKEKDAAMAEWKMTVKAKADNNMNECDSHMKSAGEHAGKKG